MVSMSYAIIQFHPKDLIFCNYVELVLKNLDKGPFTYDVSLYLDFFDPPPLLSAFVRH